MAVRESTSLGSRRFSPQNGCASLPALDRLDALKDSRASGDATLTNYRECFIARTGTAGGPSSDSGEAIEREKSMIYRTVLGQNKQGVSWTFCRSSVITLSGNDRRHSVQVKTT